MLNLPPHTSQTTLSFVSDSHWVKVCKLRLTLHTDPFTCKDTNKTAVHTHSFCCPVWLSHVNYISVILANSMNRSAHRYGYSLQHGPPILQLFHHCLALPVSMHTFAQSAPFVLNVWLTVSSVVVIPPSDCHWLTHGLIVGQKQVCLESRFSLQYPECP